MSELVLDIIGQPLDDSLPALDRVVDEARAAVARSTDLVNDDDVQLALFALYGVSYGGISPFEGEWEWHPRLVETRLVLERALESHLRSVVPMPVVPRADSNAVASALFELTADDGGPGLSKFVAAKATREHVLESIVIRTIYTLKEADPHSLAIPRLTGRAKAALVEIQTDEYGGGRPDRVHQTIFARAVRAAGLDDTYGRYVDNVPAVVLASFTMMSLLGFNGRLRGAIVGHLAAFEMTSSIPSALYARGYRRVGFGDDVVEYFDEHVEADAVHEQIAGRDLAGSLAEDAPELLPDIMFGAAACLHIDGLVAAHQLEAWSSGRSALREPLTHAVAASATKPELRGLS